MTRNPVQDTNFYNDALGENIFAYENTPIMPTTHTGKIPFGIKDDNFQMSKFGKFTISGHALLNQYDTLLARK